MRCNILHFKIYSNDCFCILIIHFIIALDENSVGLFVCKESMEHVNLLHKGTINRVERLRISNQQGECIFTEVLLIYV